MKIIIQRVQQASVSVRGKEKGAIKKGLLLLLGIKKGDTEAEAEWLVNKVMNLRIFEDVDGKMNKSVMDIGGSLLVVPNFTLYADATRGNRPGFGEAETPGKALKMYELMVEKLKRQEKVTVQTGKFGADMDVSLINDGPVTIILEK